MPLSSSGNRRNDRLKATRFTRGFFTLPTLVVRAGAEEWRTQRIAEKICFLLRGYSFGIEQNHSLWRSKEQWFLQRAFIIFYLSFCFMIASFSGYCISKEQSAFQLSEGRPQHSGYLLLTNYGMIEEYTMHSVHTGQEYRIRVQKPQNFDPAREYTIIYVADGSYGVGQFLMDPKNKISIPDNCVVIAICHTGEKEADRNRDLIPADISNNAKKNYGQANRFYLFIRDELIPFVEKEFPSAKRKVFIGHSLSGLFCLYLIFQGQQLFDHYYAISPSLWANWFELLKIENAYCDHHNDLSANITIYAGSLEVFDLIRISVYKFVNNIQKRRYKSLRLNYNIIPNARHFTIRKPVLEQIMDSLKK